MVCNLISLSEKRDSTMGNEHPAKADLPKKDEFSLGRRKNYRKMEALEPGLLRVSSTGFGDGTQEAQNRHKMHKKWVSAPISCASCVPSRFCRANLSGGEFPTTATIVAIRSRPTDTLPYIPLRC